MRATLLAVTLTAIAMSTATVRANAAQLNMSLIAQEQTQWCWGAITSTVAKFYRNIPKSQCKMASRFIKGVAGDYCCKNGKASTSECNQPFYLDRALGHYGLLNQMHGSALPQTTIISELQAARPVAFRVGWRSGGGHFLNFYSATRTVVPALPRPRIVEMMHVFDPANGGDRALLNRSAVTNYKNAGDWTHTYTTKRPS